MCSYTIQPACFFRLLRKHPFGALNKFERDEQVKQKDRGVRSYLDVKAIVGYFWVRQSSQ